MAMRVRIDTDVLRREAEEKLREVEAQCQAALDEAKRQYELDILVVERLEKRNGESEPSGNTPPQPVDGQTPATPLRQFSDSQGDIGTIRGLILEFLQQKPDGATRKNISEFIRKRHKPFTAKQIGRMLYKIKRNGDLKIIREQKGITPAIYALSAQSV